MNLRNLIFHDWRCGLLRARYLFTPLLAALPCFACWHSLRGAGFTPAPVELLMYCFKGQKPVTAYSDVLELQLPIFWLLLVGGCMFFNLDYLLKDLTNAGQQIIIRSKNRIAWYLSKCVWNLCSCGLYFIMIGATVVLFPLFTGGEITLRSNATALMLIFEEARVEPVPLSIADGLVVAFLLPLLTVSALSMLEMTLCLFVKPIVGFACCMVLLIVALFVSSPAILGNGAMAIRSAKILEAGIPAWAAAGIAGAAVIGCVVVGCLRFQRMDILGLEE